MRILYINVAEIVPYLFQTLVRMGHDVEMATGFGNINESNSALADKLELWLNQKGQGYYDFVISFNYFYFISDVCLQHDLKYVSWVYDSPQVEVFHPSIYNSNNVVFIFDQAFYKRIKDGGKGNIFYMPLAGDVDGLSSLSIDREDIVKFEKQVSFVGGLYSDNVYNGTISGMPAAVSAPLKEYLMTNLCDWTETRFWPDMNRDAVDYYIKLSPDGALKAYGMPLPQYYASIVLSRKLAEMERITALTKLSERIPVSVFTNSDPGALKFLNGEVLKPVSYETDMRKVFHLSRINLNITLPSIETGVPLRVFDIMSVGGFCLTNWQEELEDLFSIGKDLEVFHNIDELIDKAEYYLTHEQERLKIAVRGFQTVAQKYTYRHRMEKMLEIVKKI